MMARREGKRKTKRYKKEYGNAVKKEQIEAVNYLS